MFYTYILKSLKDERRYIGHTDNMSMRLERHNSGLNPSTKNRRPLKLICFKEFNTRIEAIGYERYLKSLKGGKQLEIEIKKMSEKAEIAQLVPARHRKHELAQTLRAGSNSFAPCGGSPEDDKLSNIGLAGQ